MAKRLTLYIMIGLVLGLLTGWAINSAIADGTPEATARLKEIAGWFKIVTDIFLRLIKMIIAPLVFSTLVVGIAHMGDTAALGRIGARTMGWFITASLISLSMGLLLFHAIEWIVDAVAPGQGFGFKLPPPSETVGLEKSAFSLSNFITHIVPTSIVDAMASNEIIQIVVFSIFAGVALTAIGERGRPIVAGAEALAAMMLQITDYVMRAAPLAVFAAITATIAVNGLGIIVTLGLFVGSFYVGLAFLWLILFAAAFAFIGPRAGTLLRYIREPILLAFSTASSEAAYPRTLEALDRFGVPPKIASFVLPLGYSFNLDGSMMYMTFATLFIARVYGIDLSIGTQIVMLLILMVTSKGIAGVPRASLVVIAAVMGQFGIPEAGLLLILPVDQFLDMGRSGTNVVGNAVATAVVARWEGQLDEPEEPEIEPPHAPSKHPA
ncbi:MULTISPECIES: dicarboxylate/amino acid:cation symporter [Sphingomonas]|uniref:dicarboxylate/amino acid:cation symporter n=1 Tax=Sphingomonas TaxID=13687 RepID=UPI00082EE7C7|nr:dicarboxylate/amino acid:cation symporter [Sphingomonas sp. CCH10-B3]